MSDAREELARLIAEVTRPLLYRWSNLHSDPEDDPEPTAEFAMRLAQEAARVAAGYLKRTPGGEAEIEAVATALDPEAWAASPILLTRAEAVDFHTRRQKSCEQARAVLAALSTPPRR